MCSHYILIGYVSINCKHGRLCIRVVLLVPFPCKCLFLVCPRNKLPAAVPVPAQQPDPWCSGVVQCLLGVTEEVTGLGGLSAFPGSLELQSLPWAAAADPSWCQVDLSCPIWGEAAPPSWFHPAECAQVSQLHCTDLLHFMYCLSA